MPNTITDETYEYLVNRYSPETAKQGSKYADVLPDAVMVFLERQEKYGVGNISAFGLKGVIIRMNDKLERLKRAEFGNGGEVSDETVEDTLIDLLNYAAIGLMCKRGTW